MTEELQQFLKQCYPVFFSSLYNSDEAKKNGTAIALFGIECGDGWFEIIKNMAKKIEELNKGVVCEQIKEKYATLRVYTSMDTDEVLEITDQAEKESENTCEICGYYGKVRQGSWWVTRCDTCFKK